ncbi:sodium/potassium-transporting ATPase subunit beta-1-interacting protein 2-like [Haliotis asinina]|uniref:sodium/potassium-transporting ATPase subunit beta-1-interacting protein 2-like n=1 Tax=Haliotis asinina TaxID=109174 RepID=UPI00353191FC
MTLGPYTVWSLLWLGWNLFVICIYLEDKELYILTIGTKNKSWWLEHGVGCTVTNTSWMSSVPPEASRPIPPEEFVDGCILQYYYVELLGFVVSCVTIYAYTEEEESCKYIAKSHTYNRPKVSAVAKYQPVQVRDSWCLPTYVSYTDSIEWSNQNPAPNQSEA